MYPQGRAPQIFVDHAILIAQSRSLHCRLRLGGVAAVLAVLILWKTLRPHDSWELGTAERGAQLASLLRHIFVCVTFAWRPEKIIFLKQVRAHFAHLQEDKGCLPENTTETLQKCSPPRLRALQVETHDAISDM